MRCSRCQHQVMPGLTECPACGQPVGEATPPPSTMPNFGVGVGILGQRRAVRRNTLRQRIPEIRLGFITEFFRMLSLPPVVEAAAGMAFGAWYFRRDRRNIGIAVAAAEGALLLLAIGQAVWRFQVPLFGVLVLAALMAAGGGAAYQVLIRRGHVHTQAVFMAFLTPLLLISFVAFAGFIFFAASPGWRRIRLVQEIWVGRDLIRPSAMALRRVDDRGAVLKRGDIIYGRYAMTPVVALPGDSIELTDCKVLVNGEDRTQDFAPRRGQELCRSTLARFALPDTGMPYFFINYQGQAEIGYTPWDQLWRLRLIYWPPSQWRYFP